MLGDHACAEGALAAGCRFFAGYPITPATEVAERMADRLPEVGGIYVQMEDEIASVAAILGAAWGGMKTMTATSGPGFSLMMENIGLGIITETPCVIVNVQRAGPSTGLPTLVGQGDMMQARWGSHGPYEIIALCPNSPQECFDLTVRAFNLSERYRIPVLVMTDAEVGHMTEKVAIPQETKIPIWNRKRPEVSPEQFTTYASDGDLIPPMPSAGEGYRVFVESLTHDERGYPVITAEAQRLMVDRLIAKIRVHRKDIIECEERHADDADTVVVSYGISARIAARAVEMARREGVRAGLFRPITAWPFPEERIRALSGHVKRFVVPEINMGQMVYEVERCAAGRADVVLIPHAGGDIPHPEVILEVLRGKECVI
jgi:2-oxoglutarate ferredoxin oxidoreductase subunit alpha